MEDTYQAATNLEGDVKKKLNDVFDGNGGVHESE